MADDPKNKILSTEFNQEVFDEEKVVAEKGNVGRKLTPKEYLILFEPELAPTGHLGVKRDLPSNPEQQAEEPPIDLHGHDFSLEDIEHGYLIQMRIEDEPSKKGLEGGRISRLTLVKGERKPENIKAHFDDGEWKNLPSTFLEKQIVMEKREEYNGTDQEVKKPDRGQEPDNDLDL